MPAPILKSLLDEKHSIAPEVLRRLSEEDRGRLRAMALETSPAVSRVRAFRWLSQAAPETAAEVFRQVLESPKEAEIVKATCADFAARLTEDEQLVEQFVSLARSARRPAPRARLARILGRVGGPEADEVLAELASDDSARVRRAASRARLFLDHRIGRESETPSRVEDEPTEAPTRLEVDTPTAAEAETVANHVRGYVWGARLSSEHATRWSCQGRTMMALHNRSYRPARGTSGVVGLIAGIEAGEGCWEVDWVIVARWRPNGRLTLISLAADGDPVWVGDADGSDDPVVLRTLEGRFPLVRATVNLAAGRPSVERIDRWDAPLREKQRAQPG